MMPDGWDELMADPLDRMAARLGIPAAELRDARDAVEAAPPGADFGMTRGMLRVLAQVACDDSARSRAARLAWLRATVDGAAARLFRRLCAVLGLDLDPAAPRAARRRRAPTAVPAFVVAALCPHGGGL